MVIEILPYSDEKMGLLCADLFLSIDRFFPELKTFAKLMGWEFPARFSCIVGLMEENGLPGLVDDESWQHCCVEFKEQGGASWAWPKFETLRVFPNLNYTGTMSISELCKQCKNSGFPEEERNAIIKLVTAENYAYTCQMSKAVIKELKETHNICFLRGGVKTEVVIKDTRIESGNNNVFMGNVIISFSGAEKDLHDLVYSILILRKLCLGFGMDKASTNYLKAEFRSILKGAPKEIGDFVKMM